MSPETINNILIIDTLKEKITELIQKVSTNSPWNRHPTMHFIHYLNNENTKLDQNNLDEYEKIRLFKISLNNNLESWRKIGRETPLDYPKQYFAMANVLSAEFTPIIDPPRITKTTKSANYTKIG